MDLCDIILFICRIYLLFMNHVLHLNLVYNFILFLNCNTIGCICVKFSKIVISQNFRVAGHKILLTIIFLSTLLTFLCFISRFILV